MTFQRFVQKTSSRLPYDQDSNRTFDDFANCTPINVPLHAKGLGQGALFPNNVVMYTLYLQ